MIHYLSIPNTRFTARVSSSSPVAFWNSERLDLKYPYAGRPAGSDRGSDYSVNSFLRCSFNKPLPNIVFSTYYGLVVGSVGASGSQEQQPLLYSKFFLGPPAFDSPFYTLSPLSPQVINFPVGNAIANLGQSAWIQVGFQCGLGALPFLDIDVTFKGVIVSGDLN